MTLVTSSGTPYILPFSESKESPIGIPVGLIEYESTTPPPSVGQMSTVESLGMRKVPLPYSTVGAASLIVSVKSITVVAHSLLIRSLKVEEVRLTSGAPHIVPFSWPISRPLGSDGTNVQFVIVPLIRVGEMGSISVPLSRVKLVYAKTTLGLPSSMVKDTLNSITPKSESFAQIVKLDSVMFHTGVPEMTPVLGSMVSPSGSWG